MCNTVIVAPIKNKLLVRMMEITSYSSYFVVTFGLIFILLLAAGGTPAWRSQNPSVPRYLD